MSVGRICQREVDFAAPEESVFRAAERMRDRTVGALVVLNDARQPIGIITDRDVTTRVVAVGRDPLATKVQEVMTPGPKTAGEETTIEMALSMMRGGAFRRMPVVNEADELVGIVTLDDVLMLLCDEFAAIGALLERETPAGAASP
ncbi:MAG: CBS domain-containing protein [Pirellulales bacterium]